MAGNYYINYKDTLITQVIFVPECTKRNQVLIGIQSSAA